MTNKNKDHRKKVRSFAISDADWAEAQRVADEIGATRGVVFTRSSLVAEALRQRIAEHGPAAKPAKAAVKVVNLTAQPEETSARRRRAKAS
jgi:hypothetical protein